MPASRARCSPGASARFETTTAIVRVETPVGDRVDDRLKIAAAAGDQDAEPTAQPSAAASTRSAPCDRRRPRSRPGRRPLRRPATTCRCTALGVTARRTDDDQADAHVEGAKHLVARRSPPCCCSSGRSAEPTTPADRSPRAQPSGSIRGRFSVMPPPVMCASPFTHSPLEQRPHQPQIRSVRREQRVADRRRRARARTCPASSPATSKNTRRASE